MTAHHPYRDAPARSFWSTFAATGFAHAGLERTGAPLLPAGARVLSAGSCFAANLVPYLERHGVHYVREDYRAEIHESVAHENLGYARFSAGYGHVYTARQWLQLVLRATGAFTPAEDRWITADAVLDPFRPGLRYPARTEREFDALTRHHLRATRRAIEAADVFVFTLGLTEAWASTVDGAVFPACPGTVAGRFDPERHRFVNFGAGEVQDDLRAAIEAMRRLSPSLEVVLTVSPVPLVATAGGGHVLEANSYSKAVLRVAAEQLARELPGVRYFPAFEIITGPQAPRDFFEDDRRSVSPAGVDAVMAAFFAGFPELPALPPAAPSGPASAPWLLNAAPEFECEEAFVEIAR